VATNNGDDRARELNLGRAKSLAEQGNLGREVVPSHPGENTPKWWEQVVETPKGRYVDVGAPPTAEGKVFGWQQRNKPIGSIKYEPSGEEGGMGSKG